VETAFLSAPYVPITVEIPVISITGCDRGEVFSPLLYYIFKVSYHFQYHIVTCVISYLFSSFLTKTSP